ncbi:5337_t:CDS:2 [Cetraspora pellucida]|uniref:5337_t:CDS:1 n=1 Tax=Cetraspora pellucida TaxID=1433469 RepID=A0A9N9D4T4_9GLOM|nr:5337_t:CDS:2 [Cetraspora pellucida]
MFKRKNVNVRVSDDEDSDYKAKDQDDMENEAESDKQESDEPKQKKKTSKAKKAKTKKHEDEDSDDSPAPKKSKGRSNKDDRGENDQGEAYFKKRRVTVREFKEMILVDIRDYFKQNGEYLPGKKGISLQVDQWNKLKEFVDDIDAEIKKLKE